MQKELAEVIVSVLHESVAVVLGKKKDLTNQLPKTFSFRVDNEKFLNFGRLPLCKVFFWEKGCLSRRSS